MRLLVEFKSNKYVPYNYINKHTIQGVIYSLLTNTDYEFLHDKKGFKYFTFSDVFPIGDYYPNKTKKFIISSPDDNFINTLYEILTSKEFMYIKEIPFEIINIKKFKLNLKFPWQSGSPIVLYIDNKLNYYFSFSRGNITFFLKRLKENSIKKFNSYYGEDFSLNEPLFDEMVFSKEVAINLTSKGYNFLVLGSVWKKIYKKLGRRNKKFYSFLMDCGLGEKNSLGFGFVNPIKRGEKGEKNQIK